MRVKTAVSVASAVLSVAVFAIPAFSASYSAKVVSVIDGDTLNIMHNGNKEKVILFGVDCPELGQQFGTEAKDFTDKKCYGQFVTVDDRGQDSHGRTIAIVSLPDGTNLNQELVKQGLAWWSDKFAPNDAQLKQLFQAAKKTHIGLWADPNPVPPWIFRNGSRSTAAEILKSK